MAQKKWTLKKNEYLFKHVKADLLPIDVIVLVSNDFRYLSKVVRDYYKFPLDLDVSNRWGGYHFSVHAYDKTGDVGETQNFIFLKHIDDPYAIQHEVIHFIWDALTELNIRLSDKEHEIQAYSVDYFTRKIYNAEYEKCKFDPDKKRKRK